MTDYAIVAALPEHLQALPVIELRAAARFRTWNVPDIVFTEATPLAAFEAARADGLLWVAVASAEPVGFALASASAARFHLEELDVVPEHAGRGIGLALIAEVESCARARGCADLTLTTYRDVPWNAPFYRRHGFRQLDLPDAELVARLDKEASRGFATMPRVAMRKVVGRPTGRSS